jgi:hypothetical protein
MLKPTVGVKLRAQFLGRRQCVLGTINGMDGHTMPEVLIIGWEQRLALLNCSMVEVLEGRPTDMGSCLGQRAAMKPVAILPQSVAGSVAENLVDLGVDAGGLAAATQGKNGG